MAQVPQRYRKTTFSTFTIKIFCQCHVYSSSTQNKVYTSHKTIIILYLPCNSIENYAVRFPRLFLRICERCLTECWEGGVEKSAVDGLTLPQFLQVPTPCLTHTVKKLKKHYNG